MRITEVDNPVSQVQLAALERALDKVFAQIGIDVEFTRHFLDRVNDERNIRQITLSELGQLFKKEFIKWGKPIARLGPDAQAVMKDLASDINIPFALNWNSGSGMLELVAKTVMRKKNFSTPNKEFPVESYTLNASQLKKINESLVAEAGPAMLAAPIGVGAMELLALALGFSGIAAMQQAYKANPDVVPSMVRGAVDLYNKGEQWIKNIDIGQANPVPAPAGIKSIAELQQQIKDAAMQSIASAQAANSVDMAGLQSYLDNIAKSDELNAAGAAALAAAPEVMQSIPDLKMPELGQAAQVAIAGIQPGAATNAPPTLVAPNAEPAPDLKGLDLPPPAIAKPAIPTTLAPPVAPSAKPAIDISLPPIALPAPATSAIPAAMAAARAATATRTTTGRTTGRRKPDDSGDDNSDYDDPLQKWVKKWTPSTFESAKGVITEGGAMPGVGAIHISEIEPTLRPLEKILGLDLVNNTLGSVGKKQFSGDIDVALNIPAEEIPAFVEKLKKTPLILDLAKSSVIMTKIKIADFDPEKQAPGKERTGFVQLDFMPGDPGWLKTYYHSPSETESKYKGVFRNIMLSTIAAVIDRTDSDQKLEDGRSMESTRYMWSPTEGLIKVRRTPVANAKGTGYTKKNNNEIIEGPWKQPDEIVAQLHLDSPADLNSFESLLAAVKKNYSAEAVQKIIKGFADNSVVQDIGVPAELSSK